MIPAINSFISDACLVYTTVAGIISAFNFTNFTKVTVLCNRNIRTIAKENVVSQVGSLNTLGFPIFRRGVDHIFGRFYGRVALRIYEFHVESTSLRNDRYTLLMCSVCVYFCYNGF